ncbi:MAG: hypothetical protein CK424_08715 [Legionella sp.]|nr:MAG: hypothetical protein CK424_08715 [Legionella sp.]
MQTPNRSGEDHQPVVEQSEIARWMLDFNPLTPQNFAFFNIFRSAPASAPQRSAIDMQEIRLKLMSAYIKFVIQALCYLLATYIAWKALSVIFSLSFVILIPTLVFIALQAAAKSMYLDAEGNFDTLADDHIQASLSANGSWAMNKGFKAIDTISEYATSLFFTESVKESLKNATFLDNQIAFIPTAPSLS